MYMHDNFYKTDPESESQLRREIANSPQTLEKVKKRLSELLALPQGRCVVSDIQREYLKRVVG